MLKIIVGRIICSLTIFLMGSSYAFTMQSSNLNLMNKKIEFKKKTTTFIGKNDINEFVYLEIEEIEDNEEIVIFDLFHNSDISVNSIFFPLFDLEKSHSLSTKNTYFNYNNKRLFREPKWLCLRKIIL
ncbi:MAG: hypothetical protein HYR91_12615 [Flavobacteriia bacterium]|nr:hypothetical protein [Flavobacteriia bacterium]